MAGAADTHSSAKKALKRLNLDNESVQLDNSEQPTLQPVKQILQPIISNILQLNDDCLDQIFCYLSLSDLLAISDTCTRFKGIAPKVFTFVHKIIDLKTLAVKDDITKCEQLLRNFGHLITTLIWRNVEPDYDFIMIHDCMTTLRNEELSLLNQLVASGPVNLKSLHLYYFVIDDEIATPLRSICGNLDSLRMVCCRLPEYISKPIVFFERWKLLKNLEVGGPLSENFHTLFDNSFPQLEELSLGRFKFNQIDDTIVKSFFENHTMLKCLKITTFKKDMEGSRLFNHIQSNFNGALELTLSDSDLDDTLKPVLQPFLKSLKLSYCRRLDHSSIDARQLFSECDELLTLAIPAGFITNAMKWCFPQLQYLELDSGRDDFDTAALKEFLRHHPKLNELTFNNCLSAELQLFLPEIIENDLKQLRKLTAIGSIHFDCLKQLKNVRKIFLQTYQKKGLIDFIRGTASVESVEYLDIRQFYINAELIAAIGKFTNLRQLILNIWYDSKLESSLTGTDFVNLVMELRNLRFLTLNLKNFELDAETHKKINEIVSERKQSLNIFTKAQEAFPEFNSQFEFGKRVADTN